MFKDTAPKGKPAAIRQSRRLRQEMSLPEVLLWQELRKRPFGLKFRRQRPTGDALSLDFYCIDAKLAIEVDGEAHARADRPARDKARDAWLASEGVATLRIAARDVLRDLESVIRHVVETARARLPLHHPAAPDGPPPRDKHGEA
ncbi:endonuclease domain-containing protein [Sphingomonas sp.]|uniref:endonuclease domain-containing protein n=1 Tax=Sphingomonas sp. TaxID=28214 RepID=UPI0033417DA6